MVFWGSSFSLPAPHLLELDNEPRPRRACARTRRPPCRCNFNLTKNESIDGNQNQSKFQRFEIVFCWNVSWIRNKMMENLINNLKNVQIICALLEVLTARLVIGGVTCHQAGSETTLLLDHRLLTNWWKNCKFDTKNIEIVMEIVVWNKRS